MGPAQCTILCAECRHHARQQQHGLTVKSHDCSWTHIDLCYTWTLTTNRILLLFKFSFAVFLISMPCYQFWDGVDKHGLYLKTCNRFWSRRSLQISLKETHEAEERALCAEDRRVPHRSKGSVTHDEMPLSRLTETLPVLSDNNGANCVTQQGYWPIQKPDSGAQCPSMHWPLP